MTVFMLGLGGELQAVDAARVIQLIRAGDRDVLASISMKDFEPVHRYKGEYYYIPRRIGAAAVRSLFGGLRNPDPEVKKLCADNLYQLKLTYVHKKLILHYLQKEQHLPTRLALQDLLVRINEERFAGARESGDRRFLAKVTYEEISDFVEKGYPSGEAYTLRDYYFLLGGLENPQSSMRAYVIRMMGRLSDENGAVSRSLRSHEKKERDASVRQALTEALGCLRNPSACPDPYQSRQ